MIDKNEELSKYLKDRRYQKLNSPIINIYVGFFMGLVAVFLAIAPGYSSSTIPVEQRSVTSFLAGMFGFASIDILRKSLK
jgi:hypothetical protein